MLNRLTADEVRAKLNLQPHPTCGYIAPIFESQFIAPEEALQGFSGPRHIGFTQWFMVTTDRPVHPHRIGAAQIYHHYLGADLEVMAFAPDGTVATHRLANTLSNGALPLLLIPEQTFHTAHIIDGEFALLSTTLWPAVDPAHDVELSSPDDLMARFPQARDQIAVFFS
ncbi:MAG: cupin domain-containing protein [Candidatus Eremiobacteraeota bacterium]|nr:cupin domain-containing protein [Candidatus Eremiobacteraeota bacterium]